MLYIRPRYNVFDCLEYSGVLGYGDYINSCEVNLKNKGQFVVSPQQYKLIRNVRLLYPES